MLNNIKNGPFNPSKSHVVHKITLICAHLRPSFCTYRHVSPNSLKKQRYLHWLLKTPWLANEDAFMRCWRRLPKIRLIDLWNASLQRSATTHLCFVPIMITYTLLPKLFLPIESRTVVILQVALAEIPAIALQFLLGEQTKAEPLIQQVAFAKLEILFANTVFLQTDCKQNCKQRWI